MKSIFFIVTALCFTLSIAAQPEPEYFGLQGQQLTALDINYSIIAVGTDRKGVYWQFEPASTDTDWVNIALDSTILAVYPHKSGPIGWAISAGINPGNGEPPYVFCSTFGEEFMQNSMGIDPSLTSAITDIDGFPDQTICGETYAVGNRALYRRYYADTIWQPVFTATIEGEIAVVKVRQTSPGVVLLGGVDGFAGRLLARSLDFGDNWETLQAPGMVSGIAFWGSDADTIFTTTSDKIYRTMDGGTNWDEAYQSDFQFQLTEVIYDHETNSVYAAGGTTGGDQAVLLASHDFGLTWEEIPTSGLGPILGLEAGSDNWIYFITRDEGVFRFRAGTTGTDDMNDRQTISLHQNYPNPFTTKTRIDYRVLKPGRVELSVFNAAGVEIATLVNARKSAGIYTVDLDASSYTDGVYFITLRAGGQRATCRALVLHN